MESQYQQNNYFDDYLRVIHNRKNIIAIFFVTTVLIVTIGSFLMKPIYRATATLLIDIESATVFTSSDSVALGTPNYYAYKEYFQSQKEMVKSRGIVKQVFNDLNLKEAKAYRKSDDPIKKFLKTINVEAVRDTRLLLLHVDNQEPKLAADIANRIASIYVMRNLAYITKSEELNLLKNEYLKLQDKLSEYTKIYKHKHPKMIRLKQKIEQMATRIKKEKERAGVYILDEDQTLTVSSEDSASILTGLKANNISIQDSAEIPLRPIKPKKRLNILLSLIVGLFGGVGLAFLFEYMEDVVNSVEDIRRTVKWPILGSIPHIMNKDDKLTEFQKDLFVHLNPRDPASEAYRAIRTSILFSFTDEHPITSIVITSPGPQEGKTTTLCNLGIALAQSQKRVLLVDADMRKPRLHAVFKIKNETGLSNFLSGQTKLNDIIKNTDIDNISLVTAGPFPPNPSELLESHKLKDFINDCKKDFDFIIFDSPPIAVVTDATIISRAADGVVVVTESSKTIRGGLLKVDQALTEARARIIGALLNNVAIVGNDYHYYHAYYGK